MSATLPQSLPLLSRGKHRRPEDGACFMEMASVLAGARWSDDPPCTHPLLAHLARAVNDATSDDARPRLGPLIPSVIGLTSTDVAWTDAIAVLAAATALPLVAEEDQAALAAGLLTCDALLAAHPPQRALATLRSEARDALAGAPEATAWAIRFTAGLGGSRGREDPGRAVIEFAVRAIATSDRPDADGDLRGLLGAAVDLCLSMAAQASRTTPTTARTHAHAA